MKSWIWPVAILSAVIGLESYVLHHALQEEIRDVCGKCEPAESTETQGFGSVDAGDQSVKLVDGGIMEAAEGQRELDAQKRVDYLKSVCEEGLKGTPLCRLSTRGDLFFCSVHATSETGMRHADTACWNADGEVFGHTTGLDVLCDLSALK